MVESTTIRARYTAAYQTGQIEMRLLLLLLATAASLQWCYADQNITRNASRCDVDVSYDDLFFMRGTGYYWVEYASDVGRPNRQLLMLIASRRPMFRDRPDVSMTPITCEDQTILDFVWIDVGPGQFPIDSFDCHVTNDIPLPPGELVFGNISNHTTPGLFPAVRSWKATISPGGKGGSIHEMPDDSPVLCTVLPGIDSGSKLD